MSDNNKYDVQINSTEYELTAMVKDTDGQERSDYDLKVDRDSVVEPASVSAGEHTVQVIGDGYKSEQKSITVKNDMQVAFIVEPHDNTTSTQKIVIPPLDAGELENLTNKKLAEAIQNSRFLEFIQGTKDTIELYHPSADSVIIRIKQDDTLFVDHEYKYEWEIVSEETASDSEYKTSEDEDSEKNIYFQSNDRAYKNPIRVIKEIEETLQNNKSHPMF
jgi:hypothetical protein